MFISQESLMLHFKTVVWDHIIVSVSWYSVMRLKALPITAGMSGDGILYLPMRPDGLVLKSMSDTQKKNQTQDSNNLVGWCIRWTGCSAKVIYVCSLSQTEEPWEELIPLLSSRRAQGLHQRHLIMAWGVHPTASHSQILTKFSRQRSLLKEEWAACCPDRQASLHLK